MKYHLQCICLSVSFTKSLPDAGLPGSCPDHDAEPLFLLFHEAHCTSGPVRLITITVRAVVGKKPSVYAPLEVMRSFPFYAHATDVDDH